jgi:inosose dehydratase
MAMRLACQPITWNAWPDYPVERKLAEIAAAGYAGCTIAFPTFDEQGEPASPPAALAGRLAAHGLAPAPGYLGGDLWLAERRAELVAAALARARYSRALEIGEVYVSCSCPPHLLAVAGHASGRRVIGLDDAGFASLAETLNAMGEATTREGVTLCYHNHAGSYVETEAEYEEVVARTDPELVRLGPDTGHLAIGGGDVVGFFRRHAGRIAGVHLKDINPAVLERGRAERRTYHEMQRDGLFAELGEGMLDFPALLAALRAADFDGWLIAETDRTMKPTARESVEASRAYLRTLGV